MHVSGQHDHFIPVEEAPGTHWIGGLVGPKPVWTRWRVKKILPGIEPRSPSPSPSHYTDWATLALIYNLTLL
jgi:hypothetical protein